MRFHGRNLRLTCATIAAIFAAAPGAALGVETFVSPIAVRADADFPGGANILEGKGTPPAIVAQPAAPCPEAAALPVEEAKRLVARIAVDEGVRTDLALAVAKIESRYRSTAVSARGAYGLMQLMPDTARRMGVDLCDAEDNVRGGARLLHRLQARYRNPFVVLAAYNAGEAAVRRNRGVPPFPETVRFVADVVNDLHGWPSPGAAPSDNGSEDAPLIVEVGPTKAPPAADAGPSDAAFSPQPAAPRWRDGFIMHVD